MATPGLRCLQSFRCNLLCKNHVLANTPNLTGCLKVAPIRTMASGARQMVVRPSRFNWTRFKDDFHFYLMLGVVPLGSIMCYANFIVGEAELAEIPEGYEPKHWEYLKHPIHRWFAKYVYDDPVKGYEMEVCKFTHDFETVRHRARVDRVKRMMREDDDFRAWYFVPAVDPREHNRLAEYYKEDQENKVGSRFPSAK